MSLIQFHNQNYTDWSYDKERLEFLEVENKRLKENVKELQNSLDFHYKEANNTLKKLLKIEWERNYYKNLWHDALTILKMLT